MDKATQAEFRRIWNKLNQVSEATIRTEGAVKTLHDKVKGMSDARLWRNTQFAAGAILLASDLVVHVIK